MRIMIIGADGYLGWPTAMMFSQKGHSVSVVDNFSKRRIELEEGVEPLWDTYTLHSREKKWKKVTGKTIDVEVGDITNDRFVYSILEKYNPEAIIHYGEQPSAPYSMQGLSTASYTQYNNVIGNLNLLFAIKSKCPDAHLIKLGTMGEYGTPNIDIEEGYLDIEHKGRKDTVLFPKKPFSFYHLSKVHDSNNIYFTCKTWGLRATDLNQGFVYGIDTNETDLESGLNTSFHYDDVFGTVLNRFCVQAVCGIPLTVYGSGNQTRACLNIRDTLQCVELAVHNPADKGEYKVLNQFTESFSIMELALKVKKAALKYGLDVNIQSIDNPREEQENHYYNPINSNLIKLGLEPIELTEEVIGEMLQKILLGKDRINKDMIMPRISWKK